MVPFVANLQSVYRILAWAPNLLPVNQCRIAVKSTHFTGDEKTSAYSRAAGVYGGFYWTKDRKAISNHSDLFLLACLRAGHAPLMKANDNLLDSLADPPCPLRKGKPQKTEHWLWRCPRLDGTTQDIFGSSSLPPRALILDTERVLALARVTLQSVTFQFGQLQ